MRRFQKIEFLWGLLLGAFLFCHELFLHAAHWPFDLDETNGIHITMFKQTWGSLIREVPAQASPSPLYYLIEKAWMVAWGNEPQRYWDLRVFFRISSVFYWVAACIGVYFYAVAFWRREKPGARTLACLLFGTAVSVFLFKNPFAQYYAMNARPYSLWVALSVFHFLFFVESVRRAWNGRFWATYAMLCLVLTLTSAMGIAQVALGFFLYLLQGYEQGGWDEARRRLPRVAGIFGVCALPTAYYLRIARDCENAPSPISEYFNALEQIFLSSGLLHFIRLKGAGIGFAFLAFLTTVVYFCRTRPAFRWYGIYGVCMLASTPLYFILCRIKHVTVSPRHYISLIPVVSWGVLVVYSLLIGAGVAAFRRLNLTTRRRILLAAGLAAILILPSLWVNLRNSVSHIRQDPALQYFYGLTRNPACPKDIPYMPDDFNRMNLVCRSLAGP